MIRKVAGLIICFSLGQAAVAIEQEQFSFGGNRITGQSADGKRTIHSLGSNPSSDEALFTGIMAGRDELPIDRQSVFPFGTYGFHSGAAVTRAALGIKYHAAVVSSPEGDPLNSLIAGIGVMPRHGYNLDFYPEITHSLDTLSVAGNDRPGIANFAVFVHPKADSEALFKNTTSIVNLIRRLAADQERLPEERSQESGDVKTRAVPEYLAAFFHPDHPILQALEANGFVRLKDFSGENSHMLDIYIDGPVDACVNALKGQNPTEANVVSYFKDEAARALPWRATFILPLTSEAKANLSRLAQIIASQSEYTNGVSNIAVNVALRKLGIS